MRDYAYKNSQGGLYRLRCTETQFNASDHTETKATQCGSSHYAPPARREDDNYRSVDDGN